MSQTDKEDTTEGSPMNRFQLLQGALGAITTGVDSMARLALVALVLMAGLANSAEAQTTNYVDPNGREWLWLDDTFSFAGSVPSLCDPLCSGVVTQYDYRVQTNAYTNPRQLQLDGWAWADNDEVQALMDTTPLVSLGLSYMFVTTYSYSAGVHATTSTFDPASGQYYVGYGFEGHNMVSFSAGQAIVPGPAPSSGPRGAFLYRLTGIGGILANDDVGQVPSPAGGIAVADVLANDFVDGAPATLANATISADPSGPISLNDATGEVVVAAGAAPGVHTLTYQACATASPTACDTAVVTVTVPTYVIDARDDAGTVSPTSGGIAIASVLNNDSLGGVRATVANVALVLLATDDARITLDPSDGSVDAAAGIPVGSYALAYRICELANPTNCDTALATIAVARKVIYAGDDAARASSKVASTAITSVFANDTLAGVRASSSSVHLSLVSAPPKNVVLNTTTGAVRVTRKTESGLYRFTYRICEIADPGNCDDAVVTLDLSGGGN